MWSHDLVVNIVVVRGACASNRICGCLGGGARGEGVVGGSRALPPPPTSSPLGV